jgi:hypothetical protein
LVRSIEAYIDDRAGAQQAGAPSTHLAVDLLAALTRALDDQLEAAAAARRRSSAVGVTVVVHGVGGGGAAGAAAGPPPAADPWQAGLEEEEEEGEEDSRAGWPPTLLSVQLRALPELVVVVVQQLRRQRPGRPLSPRPRPPGLPGLTPAATGRPTAARVAAPVEAVTRALLPVGAAVRSLQRWPRRRRGGAARPGCARTPPLGAPG